MDRTNGHDQEPITQPVDPPSPPGAGSGRDVFGVLLSIMKSLGRVEAKQESLEQKIDSMSDVKPKIARLDERSQTVRNIAIAALVGIALLVLRDCDMARYFRAAPASPAIEAPTPAP